MTLSGKSTYDLLGPRLILAIGSTVSWTTVRDSGTLSTCFLPNDILCLRF